MSDEADFIRTICSLAGISALAAASRSILTEDRRCFWCFVRGLVLAGFVGTMAGLLIQDYNFTVPTQGGIVGIAAFIADDLLMILLGCARKLRDKPTILIDYFLKRGGDKS